jgi:hypothetical protein
VPDHADGNVLSFAAGLWATGGSGGSRGKDVTVVGRTALGVTEHMEGLHDELQFGRHGFTAGNIRMVAAHQGAVGAGDFLL